MRRPTLAFRQAQFQRLLLWVPLLSALLGATILLLLGLAAPVYLSILAAILVFDLLALFGPSRLRPVLLTLAPGAYALFLLTAWLVALYLLPAHPASPVVLLAVLLHTTTIYVFFFVQRPPTVAALQAGVTLGAFVVAALPHSWQTLGESGAFDGVILPVNLLFAHGVLILVLLSFSRAQDQLSQEQARSRALYDLAHRDPLTGLLNRRALEDDLARAAGEGSEWLLAVIDVDGLKGVNDTLGHAVGDDLLARFAAGFAQAVSPEGRAYRLSGDEFALFLPGQGPEVAERMVDEVTGQVRAVYELAGASVGTAPRRPGETPSAWLSRADRAMYRHKKRTAEEPPPP